MALTAYMNAIEEAEQELEKLKKENSQILQRISTLENFIRTGAVLAGDGNMRLPRLEQGSLQMQASDTIAPNGSIADQVSVILQEAGKPLHAKEILRRLKRVRAFSGKNPLSSVVITIRRHSNRFKKTKPNTFTLVENKA